MEAGKVGIPLFIGGTSKVMLNGVTADTAASAIPEI